MKTIKIKENDVGIRIDKFIRKLYQNFSLSLIYKLLRTKKIKVNGKKIDIDYKLQLNDTIEILSFENLSNKNVLPNQPFLKSKNELKIAYEDDNLLIINKPKKLLVYDEKNEKFDTLINRAKKYLYKNNKWNYQDENQFEPSLLHRLDFNTDGLVMIAKNHKTLVDLNDEIKQRNVDKYYLCEVYGKMPEKEETLIAYWKKDLSKNIVYINKEAKIGFDKIITKYKVLSYDKKNDVSKLEVLLITGKTHQIRAHLSFIGHPILGETKYIQKQFNKNNFFSSQQLTSYKIEFNIKNSEFLKYLNDKIITLK